MASSYLSHLECSSGCGAGPFDPREAHFLCPNCKLPMLARYDLKAARAEVTYDPSKAKPEAIVARVEEEGYKARIL